MMVSPHKDRTVAVAVILLLALVPIVSSWLGQPYYTVVFGRIVILGMAAVGLNLILGFGGMVSFGHALYIGLGVYSVGILDAHGISNGFWHLGVALLVSGVLSVVVGAVSLRTSGMAFIMITLAFSQMFYFVAVSLKAYGGDNGMPVQRASDFSLFDLSDSRVLYYVALGVLALLVAVIGRVVESRFGLALRGAKVNASRMASLGFRVAPYRIVAYVASALICALAGVLLANLTHYAAPSYMQWTASGELIIMALLGGMGKVIGPVLGAAVLVLIEEVLTTAGFGLPAAWQEFVATHWMALLGIFIVVVPLVVKNGVYDAIFRQNVKGRVGDDKPPVTNDQADTEAPEPSRAPVDLAAVARLPDRAGPASSASDDMLILKGLDKRYGNVHATRDLSLRIGRRELHAIIGPNGAGKSTLVALLTGNQLPDKGTIEFDGRDITDWSVHRRALAGMARSYQITSLLPGFTALDNVAFAVQAQSGHSFRAWRDATQEPSLRDPARHALHLAGLGHREDVLVDDLAHGEQRQLELAIALAMQPAVLILDEPMAGMGSSDSWVMFNLLQSLKQHVSIVLIEHDMQAVFALADRITVLVAGHPVFTGSPSEVREDAQVRQAYLGESCVA